MPGFSEEIAASAARLVIDEGLDYASAKRKAARQWGRQGGREADLPSHEAIEDAVREELALFHADTQPAELRHLRELARGWMQRMGEFQPHLAGAVWRGTATRHSPIWIDLYCDDPKAPELALLNARVDVDSQGGTPDQALAVLSTAVFSRVLADTVTLHFIVNDHLALRGALKPDSRGRSWRGPLAALDRLLAADASGSAPGPEPRPEPGPAAGI